MDGGRLRRRRPGPPIPFILFFFFFFFSSQLASVSFTISFMLSSSSSSSPSSSSSSPSPSSSSSSYSSHSASSSSPSSSVLSLRLRSSVLFTRSGLFSNRALRFDFGFDRLCSIHCQSEESASMVIPFLPPLMGRSKRSIHLNPTGVCNFSYSSSRQDKYNLPTPIVLNLYSKFNEDFGVLHGLKSVMDEVYYASSISIRRVVLRGDRCYYNCTSRRVRYKLYSPLVFFFWAETHH